MPLTRDLLHPYHQHGRFNETYSLALHKMISGFSSPWFGIEELRSACLGMVFIDIEALLPGDHLFTPRERARALRLGSRRLRSFTAARVALKTLSRRLGIVEKSRPEWAIETIGPDGVSPCLAESDIYCSASHSNRFVVAVAHRHPIGVDLEMVSEKIMRIHHFFLRPSELKLISPSPLGLERTATRLWTVKEAAAKIFKLHLLDAFREVEVVRVGENEGEMVYREKAYPVKHAEGNGQVVTFVSDDAF